MTRKMIITTWLVGFVGLFLASGCAMDRVSPDIPGEHGITYYLDGAGGGGLVTNWGRGVKTGLEKGGYRGEFREFKWQTGMGVLADQVSSVDYKRSKARELAAQIVQYTRANPGKPINLVGLSAGTAVAVYTLEALPKWCTVDVVVLLGSSIEANYNLTRALQRVEDQVYVFTSSRDAVLGFLVPMAGTADREYSGREIAGLVGFKTPPYSSPETRMLYTKVINVHWQPKFQKTGDFGGHTDATQPKFVTAYITPLLVPEGPRNLEVES
jgi:hypothetical protein